MNTPLAILLQIVGSFLFAGGATLQHLAIERRDAPESGAADHLSFGGLVRLFTLPKWLAGLGLIAVGAGLQLFALTMAPVTVVQPVGILAVPWSVLLASRIYRHPITRMTWLAVGLTVLGVVGFTIVSSTSATGDSDFSYWSVMASFGVVCLVGIALAMAARRAPGWAVPILWSSVGAVFYGLATGLMKSAMNLVRIYGIDLLHWQVLLVGALILICYILGVWMIQQGYASGPAEVTVGTMTTVDPLIAVLFGIVVLGEGARMRPTEVVLMLAFGVLSVLGVVLLSRHHPEVLRREEEAAGAAADPPAS